MNLAQLLQSKPLPCYLVHCSPDFQILQESVCQILQQQLLVSRKYKFTVDRYFKFQSVWDLVSEQSLFAENTYLELAYKTKPTTEHTTDIQKLCAAADSNLTIVITCNKLSNRDLQANYLAEFTKHNSIVSLDSTDIKVFAHYKLSLAQLSISNDAIMLLQELNQANIVQLFQIIEQLTLLFPVGYKIQPDDIKQYTIDNSQYNIYQLSTAYLHANLSHALKILDNIYQKPEDAILIQWMITEDIRKLLKIKAKLQQKLSFSQISEEMKIWSNSRNLWENTTRRLNYTDLLNLLDQLSILDLGSKGVVNNDIKQQLTDIITTICTHNKI